jgi:hypothetical protein
MDWIVPVVESDISSIQWQIHFHVSSAPIGSGFRSIVRGLDGAIPLDGFLLMSQVLEPEPDVRRVGE